MFDAITSNHGMVNQMEGDGLMAIFGAPVYHNDHRAYAVNAAMKMIELLGKLNQERIAQGEGEIRIGIGIASSRVIAGYTGSNQRATFTCVGDTVNLASRIEKHTKVEGKQILIGQDTREGLSDDLNLESLGPVIFQGKQQPVNIFAVSH